MIANYREQFNSQFTEEKYQRVLAEIEQECNCKIQFRVSETPVFLPKDFKQKLQTACDDIVNQLEHIDFATIKNSYLPKNLQTANPTSQPHFLAIDFGVCESENGELLPQLIELQAFPSLFAYQVFLGRAMRKVYDFPENLQYFLNGNTEKSYLHMFKNIVLGNEKPEHVILMEVYPDKQKTSIDFAATEKLLGIQTVCITEITKEGNQLFYSKNGEKTQIKRIYNRVIFDELHQFENLTLPFQFSDELDVTWVTHPDWFYLISKSILPLLKSKYVPKSYYAHEFPKEERLEDFVLKPLFSFAGKGVNLHPTLVDLQQLEEPKNYILQEKVEYKRVIPNPKGIKSKVEIRILYFWEEGKSKPEAMINLARMSKGEMINVGHNTEDDWIGGTIFFSEV